MAKKPATKGKKNRAAVSLGRLGGMVGGIVRAAVLTPKQRSDIARMGAAKRWGLEYKAIFNYDQTVYYAKKLIKYLQTAAEEKVVADTAAFEVLDSLANALLDWNEFQQKAQRKNELANAEEKAQTGPPA